MRRILVVYAVAILSFLPVTSHPLGSVFSNLLADTKLIVYKSFKGGQASTVQPNQSLAAWGMTVDKVTTKRELIYLGRTGETTIEIESRETERPVKGGAEKLISSQKIPIYLDCDGETICRVEEISLALRVSGNTLHYTIMSDWDEVYVNQKDRIRQCEYGHKWVEKEYLYCPICGLPLKASSVKPTAVTASSPDQK
jgi:hypothetical protein